MKRIYLNKHIRKTIVNALLTMESTYLYTVHCANVSAEHQVEIIRRHKESRRLMNEAMKVLDINL